MAVEVHRPVPLAEERGRSGESGPVRRAALLMHGFTGSAAVWADAVRDRLADRVAVCPDALGHGASDPAPDPADHALANQAALVLAALDALGLKRVHAVGYSMGGRLLLALAVRCPERFFSLTLEGASPGIADRELRSARRAQDEVLAQLLLRDGVAAFVRRWEDLPLFASQKRLPEAVTNRQREIRLAQNPEGLAASLRGAGQGLEPPRWEELGRITCPVLFVAGQEDARYGAVGEAVARAVPNGRLTTIPDSGHSPHLERPEAFWTRVLAFWQDAEAKAGAGT